MTALASGVGSVRPSPSDLEGERARLRAERERVLPPLREARAAVTALRESVDADPAQRGAAEAAYAQLKAEILRIDGGLAECNKRRSVAVPGKAPTNGKAKGLDPALFMRAMQKLYRPDAFARLVAYAQRFGAQQGGGTA
jgi:hypothetical protein